MIHWSATCNFVYAATDTTVVMDSLREFGVGYTTNNVTVDQSGKEFFPLNILNSLHIQCDHIVRKHVYVR